MKERTLLMAPKKAFELKRVGVEWGGNRRGDKLFKNDLYSSLDFIR